MHDSILMENLIPLNVDQPHTVDHKYEVEFEGEDLVIKEERTFVFG